MHVNVAWAFDSYFFHEFNVCAPIDLNEIPDTKMPVSIERSKQFTFCCVPVGGLYCLSINLPYSGFCNEQNIPISLKCANNSTVYIKGIKVELHKLVIFHSKRPRKETKLDDIKLTVLRFQDSVVDKYQTKQFFGELRVPGKTALNLANCSIIDVAHRLRVVSKLSGCRFNYVVDVPITIGPIGQMSGPPIDMALEAQEYPSYDNEM